MTWAAMPRWLAGAAVAVAMQGGAAAAEPPKVLRYAFLIAETGFDPAQISDLYSAIITTHIFDAPYTYDHLARPFKIRPNTAEALPEGSPDFKTWTLRIRPGIYFADDAAFKGKRRELVAQDYVYSIKRIFDPALKSPRYSGFAEERMVGIEALREAALKGKPFDYDREVEGLRALDRYTLQFKLEQGRPRFLYRLAQNSIAGAVAREVIEAYPGRAMEHPVGTGPFRLTNWRRSSRMVLERNPGYREHVYDAEPNADDAEGQALLKRFKGRRLPMIDRVEINVIEESQPRWLSFLNAEADLLFSSPLEYAHLVAPQGRLAPNLARRGVQRYARLAPDRSFFYFNMEDPVVGGYSADKVALRRAIGLAYDVAHDITRVRRGQAIPAQAVVAPHTFGYDAGFKSENGDHDIARAKALLDLYGYVDHDGDGWRDLPDGRPLVIELASSPDSLFRQFDTMWKRNLDSIQIKVAFKTAQWPEQLKRSRAGQLMVWYLSQTAEAPDVQEGFEMVYGPAAGGQNLSRFKLPAFDAIYQRVQSLPDGPERLAAIAEANKLLIAYMPQKITVHRVITDLAYPWVVGYRRPVFGNRFWHYIDIDETKRPTP